MSWTLPVLLMAPFVGSFMGLLALRLPDGRPVVGDRSRCDLCHEPLRPRDLVPVLSWALRRGRCRCGRARLTWFYPAVEVGALLVVLWAALVVDGWLLLASAVLGWTLLTLALIDARCFQLPDALTLPLIPLGLVVVGLTDPQKLLGHGLAALAGGLGFALLAWAYERLRGRAGLGLGDAKLLAAGGAWVGLAGLPGVILIAALSALTLALAQAVAGGRLRATTALPFGPHLALGIWLVWLYGPLLFQT